MRPHHRRGFIAFLFVLCCLSMVPPPLLARPPATGAPPPEPRFDRLIEALDARREALHVPGMSFAVVMDDQVVLARGLGLRDVERRLPATIETMYAVGSTTKAFTAALIATLVDEGAMDWDDPLVRHIPEFALKDEQRTNNLTVRDALCHRSGYMSLDLLWYGGGATWADMLPCLARAEPTAPRGEKMQYNNAMYLAAGIAAGNAAGSDWNTLLRERLFRPLGMNHSNTSVRDAQRDEHLALGYLWDEDEQRYEHLPMRPLDSIAPAGAINADVMDMAKWLRLQLNRGEFEGKRLIAGKQFDVMWRPHIGPEGQQYGLGWVIGTWNGRRMLSHGGGIDGFSSYVAMLPEEKIACVVLTNANGSQLATASAPLIFDALLAEPDKDEEMEKASGEEGDLDRYLGNYHFAPWDADWTVLLKDGRLAVDVPGQMAYELADPDEQGQRAFKGFEFAKVSFTEDEQGRITHMTLYQGGQSFRLPHEGVESPRPAMDESSLAPYLGHYDWQIADSEMTVLIDDGRLAVDVPGQTVYALRPPDEDGKWRFEMTDDIAVSFARNEAGAVTEMIMYQAGQEFRLPRLDVKPVAQMPSLDEVRALLREAYGAEAFEKMTTLRLSGTIEFVNQGIRGTVTQWMDGRDRSAGVVDLGVFGSIRSAIDGDHGWQASPFDPRGMTELEGAALEQATLEHPAALLGDWDELFQTVEVLAVEQRDGGKRIVVRFEPHEAPAMKIFIDAESGLIARIESRRFLTESVKVPVRTTLEDHRKVAGFSLPFRTVTEDGTTGRIIIELQEAEVDAAVPADAFDPPEAKR
ncbi:MAG: serine hydrolase [Planctomycetota bacterium]|nr:serine hydrolase [Planctomycetota bacterium]